MEEEIVSNRWTDLKGDLLSSGLLFQQLFFFPFFFPCWNILKQHFLPALPMEQKYKKEKENLFHGR